jgi:hypothetical protein
VRAAAVLSLILPRRTCVRCVSHGVAAAAAAVYTPSARTCVGVKALG